MRYVGGFENESGHEDKTLYWKCQESPLTYEISELKFWSHVGPFVQEHLGKLYSKNYVDWFTGMADTHDLSMLDCTVDTSLKGYNSSEKAYFDFDGWTIYETGANIGEWWKLPE